MIGQENSEGKFEKEWQEAFDGMRQEPPSTIWREIDRELTYRELATYKSRNVYYKWAVAAVILIASFLGMAQFIYFQKQLLDTPTADVIEVGSPQAPTGYGLTPAIIVPERTRTEAVASNGDSDNGDAGNGANGFAFEEAAELPEEAFEPMQEIHLERLNSEPFIAAANYEDKEIYRVATYYFAARKKEKESDEKYWAGLDVSSGTFDPNYESGGNSLMAMNNSSRNLYSAFDNEAIDRTAPNVREGMTAGETVTMGVNFGLKMGQKWTLESGVQYVRADATTQTNMVIQSSQVREVIPASAQIRGIPQVESIIESEDVLEYNYTDVDLENQFQFASIPVKAGYVLLDRKVSVELNAGVATNIYLGNKLTDESNDMELTIGPGDASPYREVSFSGLAGIQFGYRFLGRLDLILEPNYRQSINSLTKDESSFKANPSGFGVMTGIRFKFD